MAEASAAAPRVLCSTVGMSREDWLAMRRCGIGSSDGAAVLGLDPWRSPLAVYMDKLGIAPAQDESPAMRWGTALEPLVAGWFAEETGKRVRRRRAILQHPTVDYVIADLDRVVVGEQVPLEIKTTNAYAADEWAEEDMPLRVVAQIQHQLAITGAPYGYWAVLIGGQEARWGRLDRDDGLIAEMMRRYEHFWTHVRSGVEPEPSAPSDLGLLRRRYPVEEPGKVVALDSSGREALEDLLAASWAAKAAAAAVETAKARVVALLGDAEAGTLPGSDLPAVTYRTVARKEHTVAASASRQLVPKERVIHGR